MTLPELSWQILYGRVAWTLVLGAVLLALLPVRFRARPVLAFVLLTLGLQSALMGESAASFWLGLAFQLPSAFFAALCAARLITQWQGRALSLVLPLPLAAPLALAAIVLYVDAMGLVALGWYYAGFGPAGAPLAGLVLAAGCAWAVVRGVLRPYALALLAALCLFALLRLPTGNLWDALLDPFLALWSLVSAALGWRRRARRRLRAAQA